jgi:hypothetical protein
MTRLFHACKRLIILAVPVLTFLPVSGQSAGDELIFPDPSHKILVVKAVDSGSEMLTGRVLDDSDPLARMALAELDFPFNRQMIRMSQCARNLAGNQQGPNILYLSGNEGGFPRTGIRLVGKDGRTTDYPHLAFVDLVLDSNRLARGDLSIYTHELGHVMMGLFLGDLLGRGTWNRSPKQHVSMGITDYPTAFSEGWGIHFQRLAFDRTEKYRLAFESRLRPSGYAGMAWHSTLDEYLRLNLVRDDGYIYEKFHQQGPVTDTLGPEERILLEHTSPAFDHTRILNGQQMLSSEGVVATIFYQVDNDPVLAGHYEDPSFYRPYLLHPIPEGTRPEQIFTPVENMMLKHFRVWSVMRDLPAGGSPVMAWLKVWCREFPADREEMIRLFIGITQGSTVDDSLPALAEELNYTGQVGDYAGFVAQMKRYQKSFSDLVGKCLEDIDRIDNRVGPELWVVSDRFHIRRSLFFPEPRTPLAVNLNTAGTAELEVMMGREAAREFLQKRRESGFFTSLDQIERLGFRTGF